jgi:hypothetical protein
MRQNISIESRFCGPPGSGNGGYVCGRIANFINGSAEVTLRRPTPLDTPLTLEWAGNKARLLDGNGNIAEAHPKEVVVESPYRPSFDEAEEAMKHYTGFREHLYPDCFVCGTNRSAGDGLRIFAGAVPGKECVAAPWIPHPSLSTPSGIVKPEFLWAALDCPGYFAVNQDHHRYMLLGRLEATIIRPVEIGEKLIITGWHLGSEGRIHFSGTELITDSGLRCGSAKATWVEVNPPE